MIASTYPSRTRVARTPRVPVATMSAGNDRKTVISRSARIRARRSTPAATSFALKPPPDSRRRTSVSSDGASSIRTSSTLRGTVGGSPRGLKRSGETERQRVEEEDVGERVADERAPAEERKAGLRIPSENEPHQDPVPHERPDEGTQRGPQVGPDPENVRGGWQPDERGDDERPGDDDVPQAHEER